MTFVTTETVANRAFRRALNAWRVTAYALVMTSTSSVCKCCTRAVTTRCLSRRRQS